MKPTFISRSSLPLLSMLIMLNSYAQKSSYKDEAANLSASYETSHTFTSPDNGTTNSPGSEKINEKVLRHFNRKFNNATNIKWEEAGDNFLATFSTGETSATSLFDKKGQLIYSINYFSEKQLPSDVKNMITGKYESYTITSVAKVLQDDRTIWTVKLAGKNDYVSVRLEEGEMEEVENFQK